MLFPNFGRGFRIFEQIFMQRKGVKLLGLFKLLRRSGALRRPDVFALLRSLCRLEALFLSDDGVRSLGGCRDGRRLGRRGGAGTAQLLDIDQKIGKAALDAFQHAKARVGGVEPLDQGCNAVLQVAQRRAIGMGQLHPFELLDQSG